MTMQITSCLSQKALRALEEIREGRQTVGEERTGGVEMIGGTREIDGTRESIDGTSPLLTN